MKFNESGFPIFTKDMFLNSLGTKILPYSHRNDTQDKQQTIICFYEHDYLLYRKLSFNKLVSVAKELNNYKGFVGYDLSIFNDFLYPFQEFYILANLVISMFFVLNGNKLIPNLRSDETEGKSYFHLFKDASIVCCGTLGCSLDKEMRILNTAQITSYCRKNPGKTLIQYGSKLSNSENAICFKPYGRNVGNKNG